MAEKKHLADIKLIGSIIKDDAGKQISLTADERDAIHNAYGGPVNSTNPVVGKNQYDTDLAALRSGIRWRDPVDTVSATAPTTTPLVGARYLNSTDNKIYNCKVASTWDSGETPLANWTVFAKDTDEEWTYDEDTTHWVMRSSGNIPYASEVVPGKVIFAVNGEVSALKAVQSNDVRLVKGYYSETLSSATGTVTITHNIGTEKLIVQAWAGNDEVDIQVHKNDTDPTKKLDVVINGTATSLEINIIGLP
jgi:hypothetical protein